VLLMGAGLLLRTLQRLRDTDPGFAPDRLLAVQLSLPKRRYASPEAITRFAEESTVRIASIPGVTRVAATSLNPLTQWRANISFLVEGRPDLDAKQAPLANYRAVGADYFRTLGVPIRAGREIDSGDRADSRAVAVISETLARLHFPDGRPIGARLRIDDVQSGRTVEIVGVVGDVKFTGLDAPGAADVYVPYSQTPQEVSVWLANIFCLAVRTPADPRLLADAVRREIHAIDRDVAIASMRPMSEAVGASLAERRFHTLLLEIFGAAALGLALAGIYAVTAFAVIERTREIGVRLSLGSGPGRILKLVLGQALKPVGVGVALGAAAALALTRLLSGLLYGVAPHDLATFALTVLLVGMAACIAAAVPGLRASRIDPARALRAE
jgi:putative ABC transport system permease protein